MEVIDGFEDDSDEAVQNLSKLDKQFGAEQAH
jgi:hypothetical protein